MLKSNGGQSDYQTCTEDSQQNTANLTIAAMAAGRAAPDNSLNPPCFRLIQQLLPTFSDRSSGAIDRRTLRYATSVQVEYPSPGTQPPHNAEDVSSVCEHANRHCTHLHKICSAQGEGRTIKGKAGMDCSSVARIALSDSELHPP